MIKAYVLDLSDASLPENAIERLPSWRRERAEELRRPSARAESIWTGLLWRWAMQANGFDPDRPVVCLPAGKPTAVDGTAYFSLSHSGSLTLCAVGDVPVGADVQQEKRVNLTIANRFHKGEQEWLAAQPEEERERAFFRIWTRKEAWVKANSEEEILTLSQADVMHHLPDWSFMEYNVIAGNEPNRYLAAVCGWREAPPAALVKIESEMLLAAL